MTETSAGIEELRLRLLRRRLAERGLAATDSRPTGAAPDSGPAPMTAGQRRMWFVQTLDPAGAVANIAVSYRLSGEIDSRRMHAALTAVADRHPVLRTVYRVDDDGEPYPVVLDTGRVESDWAESDWAESDRAESDWAESDGAEPGWAQHDLSALSEPARRLRLEVLAQREFARPFRLDRESPLRLTLIRTGEREHVLLLVAHHIAWDDDCWAVFFADLTAAYTDPAAFAAQTQRRSPASVQPDKALDPETDLAYWRDVLADLPEPLELPGPNGSEVPSSLRAGRRVRTIDPSLWRGIGGLAADTGATAYMVLTAAVSVLIWRYTGVDDFLIATPVLNRTPGNDTIGYLGNTVALRARLAADDDFATVLARTRQTALGAFAHQGINLDRVVRDLNPDRRYGGAERLARLSFGLRAADGPGFAPDGVRCRRAELRGRLAQLPLGIMVEPDPDGGGAVIEAEHLLDVLDADLTEQMLDHLVQLLTAAVADPRVPVGELDMLGPADRTRLDRLSRGPRYRPAAAAPDTLAGLVEAAVAATPDAVAVVDESAAAHTYAQLNARANRIAHHLIACGVGTEDTVAVLLPRSAEQIATALGIAKAGGVYLPVDPEYPVERVDFILDDAQPRTVIREPLPALDDLPGTDPGDTDRLRPLSPDNLAYVIYTSGSTGLPKGVPVAHAPITEYLTWFGEDYRIDATDVLLQVASTGFDVSIGEIFGTLGNGARLIVPRLDGLRDIGYLTDLLATQGVTAMHFVPSLLGLFLSLPGVNRWRTLRRIPVGGEPLPGELADRFHRTFDAQLHNFYGPTEAVVNSTRFKVEGPQGNRVVPIGSPNINTTIWLLDDRLQPVPVGAIGEIYIGGEHLARGYLNRPGLTSERFVADPFADSAGGRLYRTGDLARRDGDGMLRFVGRADDQVKIRGFRIELGEVAAAISVDPSVGQCVVVAADLPGAGRSLVAYLTPAEPGGQAQIDRIRPRVAAALPEYMVPAAYVTVEDIPITIHGKIDTATLPQPELITAPYREPYGDTEIGVATLFVRLLNRDAPVGADDSFFDLGGHSLLATKLVAALTERFGVQLSIRDVFDNPTVTGMAAAVEAAPVAAAEVGRTGRPAITARAGTGGPQPLSAAQLRSWFAYRIDGPGPENNIPFTARLSGPCDTAALAAAIGDVIARHALLRTTFCEIDGVPHQTVHSPAAVTVHAGACSDSRLRAERHHIFDLEKDWPVRAALLEGPGEGEHILSLVVHHIAADHWSAEVLFADLLVAYRARVTGQAPQWDPLPVSYSDYAAWQAELLAESESGLIATQRDYWLAELADLADDTGPRPDFPRPAVAGGSGAAVEFTVTPRVRAGIAALARDVGGTELTVLQAAVAILLHKTGSGDDIPVGTPVAGRDDPVLQRLVGFFVNIVVLRNRLASGQSLREVARAARETALGAYANADLPFDRLVDAINPVRTLSRNPLFQVIVHVRDAADTPILIADGPGGPLTFTAVMPPFDIAHADLSVNFFATGAGPSSEGPAGEGPGYTGWLIYRTDLYDDGSMRRMAGWLTTVLETIATRPDTPLARLSLLPPAQRATVLDWSRGAPAPDARTTIAELLEPSRRFGAGRVAVRGRDIEGADAELSYPELHRRSDALARLLVQRDVGPGRFVGLCASRIPEMVVALLGIVKAGGGYFPLDPGYPPARLELMLADVNPPVIITDTAAATALPVAAPLLLLDDPAVQAALGEGDGVSLPAHPGSFPPAHAGSLPPAHPEDPMFLVFTSGSTGVPKGTVGTHRSMSARLSWQLDHYPVPANEFGDIRLAQSSMTFLEGGMELLAGLAAGATMVLADDAAFRDPAALAALIADHHVQQVTAVASLVSALLDLTPEGPRALRGLRRLVCSGEPVSAALLARLVETLDLQHTQLLNNFGATETSGAAVRGPLAHFGTAGEETSGAAVRGPLAHFGTAGEEMSGAAVRGPLAHFGTAGEEMSGAAVRGPLAHFGTAGEEMSGAAVRGPLAPPTPLLGRPTPGAGAYLLDDALQPVPPGVVGEVYYAGPQVVRGYAGRPGLTATRFVANPFAPGERMYRSGDRARWTVTDGSRLLEFIGRTDHQVKIRGFRVELGEVEAALAAAPGVAGAAARTWPINGTIALAGYVVAEAATDNVAFTEAVRTFVAERLPAYMVPSTITILVAMPRTDSGKLNRPALPQPEPVTRGDVDPPSTDTERALAAIIEDLLGTENVGRRDEFFALGGDSISSVQLAARARAAGLEVTPRLVFAHPSVAALAAAVDDLAAHPGDGPPEKPGAGDTYAPMSVSGLDDETLARLTATWDGP